VPEVPDPGIRHNDALLIRGINDFLITHRPTRLNNASRTGRHHHIQPIAERKEGIRGDDRTR
jgi:hypothetical protein